MSRTDADLVIFEACRTTLGRGAGLENPEGRAMSLPGADMEGLFEVFM
ncbi:MAG: hypothetical protein LJE74_09190 [Proteobacteria bacterium]|nr:hypothetical protein [Pseudomonadota bacterium]